MDFGMPTLLEFTTLEENRRLCRELGLSFVEINMNLPQFQPDALLKTDLSPRGGIYHTLHLDENFNPFDFNPDVAAAYLKTALAAIKIARENSMPIVNMHFPMGVYFTMPRGKVYLWDTNWPHLKESLLRVRDKMTEAADGKVALCIENTSFGRFTRHEESLEILLESPAFALTYDAGHDAADSMNARDFYLSHSSRLAHMHLHDAAENSCHLALGEGTLDIPALCRAHCRRVIEVKDTSGLTASVQYLKQHSLF